MLIMELLYYIYSFINIYILVPFLTISSILIDLCLTNLIFIGAIFNSYNYWYLLSYSNQFTLHYSILFLIITIIIILFSNYYIYLSYISYYWFLRYWLFICLYSFFSNFTFFIPIFLDFFIIFSIFFFKGPINSIELFLSYNFCFSFLFIHFNQLLFNIQLLVFIFIYGLSKLSWYIEEKH